jgi:hypothetical protein
MKMSERKRGNQPRRHQSIRDLPAKDTDVVYLVGSWGCITTSFTWDEESAECLSSHRSRNAQPVLRAERVENPPNGSSAYAKAREPNM